MPKKRPTKRVTTKKRRSSVRTQAHPHFFPLVLISLGLILITLWGVHRSLYNQSLTLSDVILASYARTTSKDAKPAAVPVHIAIDGAVSVPIVESGKVNNVWVVSPTHANHAHESSVPGEGGNIILYGHNKENIFGNLRKVMPDDIVNIRLTDGSLRRYTVTETQEVDTTQTQLLAPTDQEVLTLYTCSGFLDSKRFVVRAIPVQE